MKRIFIIEINEKDKNINNQDIINDLDLHFKEFSKFINSKKNLYIRFKRVGSTWQDIINNLKINSESNKKDTIKYIKIKKDNHLKLIK